MKKTSVKNLAIAALCVAAGILLPMLFHAIGAGTVFLPMHIPVLICGFICGWRYGGLCGLVVPIISSLLTGMPPIFPVATAMMFELCTYGALSGLLYRKYRLNVYISLIAAMLGGRAVSGIANTLLLGLAGKSYSFAAFISGAFVTALPGIAIQIIAVPLIIIAFEKAKLIEKP